MKIERVNKIANSMKDSEGKVSINALIERLNSISFWELLSECNKIEIPIIQRDYAQGREDEKTNKIRELFLDSLIKAIESEDSKLELDFVYGDIKNGVFQPLDGQQRLTTLWLLHWYIAFKAGTLKVNETTFKKFTYETRISSREFCNELVEKADKLGEGETLSKKITDASWFFLSWKKDPTIKSMLVMLDAIESKLNDKSPDKFKEEWDKLISDNPPITFHFKELNDIGLTDDLYIKMNARGKQLTDFENFKARFEKYIKDKEFEKDLSLTEANKEQWKELTEKTFSHRIDTVWTDLFWKHRGDDNLVDNEFVKFIAGIAINSYAENQEIFESEDEDKKRERIERRITLLFNNPNEIIPEDFPTKRSFEYLKRCFDIYSNKELKYDEKKPKELNLWDFLEIKKVKINREQEIDNNLFHDFIKDSKTEYKQRVLFYAQTQFLLNVEPVKNTVNNIFDFQTQFLLKVDPFNSDSFTEWMRVVRNIVQNATIDSANTYISAIGLIKELAIGCENIYQYLSNNSVTSKFAKNQMEEEITKAKIIINKPDAKSVIHKIEDTNFCKGKISFPLYCIDFEIEKDNLSVFDISKLEKVDISKLEKVLFVINENFAGKNLTDEFKRAFLTIKGNDYYKVWWKWSYSFSTHKGWLLNTVIDLKNNFSESKDEKKSPFGSDAKERDYLKELFLKLFDKSLKDIINEYECPDNMPNWKKRLIKEDNLLNGATFILIPKSNNYCELAWQQRPTKKEKVKKIE